nr:MAG TPA: hypothetical protein [Caudoviricetes sp.]
MARRFAANRRRVVADGRNWGYCRPIGRHGSRSRHVFLEDAMTTPVAPRPAPASMQPALSGK